MKRDVKTTDNADSQACNGMPPDSGSPPYVEKLSISPYQIVLLDAEPKEPAHALPVTDK